ncbi:hypothetical protein NL439_25710, partial [Klebsiella pneumoniae]|nr:hypothetical protein [Klebsiella pneumoniae]
INDSYIKDNRLTGIKEDIYIEIHVLQTKFEDGFKEEGINKFAASAIDIFNLKKSISGSMKYNADIQRHSKNIVTTIKKLNIRSPKITFRY